MPKTYLGVDYGQKRVGVAVGDDQARLASPLKTLANQPDLVDQLRLELANSGSEQLILGLPRGLDGQETAQTATVRQFGEMLTRAGLKVKYQDEAVTSELAREQGTRPDEIDQTAAAIILQDYLDSL